DQHLLDGRRLPALRRRDAVGHDRAVGVELDVVDARPRQVEGGRLALAGVVVVGAADDREAAVAFLLVADDGLAGRDVELEARRRRELAVVVGRGRRLLLLLGATLVPRRG